MTKIVLVETKGLIRYTAIKAKLEEAEGSEAIAALAKEIKSIGRTCVTHGYLDDPAIFVGTLPGEIAQRVIVACPLCSSPDLLAQWEAEQLSGELA